MQLIGIKYVFNKLENASPAVSRDSAITNILLIVFDTA